jgi:MerR family mercuric resistance operon transcriptional regulator
MWRRSASISTRGCLPTPDRPYGRIRRYGAVARVKFVKAAQRLGFSLEAVGQLLTLEDGTHCSEAVKLAAPHLADVRARLAELSQIKAVLSKLVGECHAHRGEVSCPLIAALRCC